ncbi:hypothetical protein GF324_01560 [bacterium]|nr:hypothetical protein [bacterium]
MAAFFGSYETRTDDRYRFPLPAMLRKQAGGERDGQWWVIRRPGGFLSLMTDMDFQEHVQNAHRVKGDGGAQNSYVAMLLHLVDPVELDKSNRVLLSPKQRKHLGIDGEKKEPVSLELVGMMNSIRVYREDQTPQDEEWFESFDKLRQGVNNLEGVPSLL